MKRLTLYTIVLTVSVCGLCATAPAWADSIQAWGSDYSGQVSQAPSSAPYQAIAAGDAHGLALTADGTVVAWGQNDDGESDVPAGSYRAIGAGADFSLAIRRDGSIAAWGNDARHQVSGVPLVGDFVSVDGGEFFAVALRSDGSIAAWGDDIHRQVSDAPTGTGFKAVVAGDAHGVALRNDGSLACWGLPAAIQGRPTSGTFTAIGAGGTFCVAVRSDGSLVWWGDDFYDYGLADVPEGTDYVDVAAGYLHAIARRAGGSLVGWGAGMDASGHPNWGQANPPAGTDYKAITCGLYFSLALTGEAIEAVIADDFDDNTQDSIWQLVTDDPANCWLDETNRRLELRATAKAEAVSAFYLARHWRIDPCEDFSFQVDFHRRLVANGDAWVSVLLTPESDDVRKRYIEFGAGANSVYSYFWFEAVDNDKKALNFLRRVDDTGTLYLSYDAARDELYLSHSGFGPTDAWATLALQSYRGGEQGVAIGLGGGSTREALASGDAYLDSFVMDSGTLLTAQLSEVYRFWSPVTRGHFYTISVGEKDKLIDKYSESWIYEGPVYKVASEMSWPGLAPVYRFWSEKSMTHFYTISETEKNKLLKELADIYEFEGVAFYAYPQGHQPAGTLPVYRFWKPAGNMHFYTISENEKRKLMDTFADAYVFEGVAFYAYGL